MTVLFTGSLIPAIVFLLPLTTPDTKQPEAGQTPEKYASAKEAFAVGAAYYNSRNFKASREPFEAVLRLTDDVEMRLRAYNLLLPSYREIPEFEPYQKAAEYVIEHTQRDAERSLTRRAFLSFAFNRGQLDNLIAHYETSLQKDPDNFLALYVLSELYTVGDRNPKRAIELIQRLAKQEAARSPDKPVGAELSDAEKVKIAREKGKLARQYAQAKQYEEAAALYEEIAPLEPTTQSYHLKEAAMAWLKKGDRDQALRLTEAADRVAPDSRNDLLSHFFHRHMGDLFAQLGKPAQAIPHYEIALQKTTIEGYIKDVKAALAEAKEATR
jgi:tetratricopeptide (TPR) repeat protein